MQNELNTLLDTIRKDYAAWGSGNKFPQSMLDEFNSGLRIEEGSKYLKIVSGTCVWGFVVKTDKHAKFKRGDILKAATWAAPATNKARGNVLAGDLSWVHWTGPRYL